MKPMFPLIIVSALILHSAQTFGPDAEGFIRNWLVLAPIAMDGESGATEIDREFLANESALKPKAEDKARIGGREFTWKAHQTSDFFIDFLQSFGTERGEYVVGYAATYVVADAPMKATLALSTNDQGKAWLNGKEVFKFTDTRTLEKDTDRVEVMLDKGPNVLVLKVVNEVNNWQACARFLANGAPVKNVKVSLAAQ